MEVSGGNNQIAPNATTVTQTNNYWPAYPPPTEVPGTVVLLGAGADAAAGMPTGDMIVPGIVKFLATEEGASIDKALRTVLKNLRFRFEKQVSDAIDRFTRGFDKEREGICRKIEHELEANPHLKVSQQKLGRLIVRLFTQISDLKRGADIDDETVLLIREVLGTELSDTSIIDFSRISYTATFTSIVTDILQKSMNEAHDPILRHVFHGLLDIESFLAQYFYGFYTGQSSMQRTYMYISWMLWAYLVHEQQALLAARSMEHVPSAPFYSALEGRDVQVITFNYTTFAAAASPSALYFHGSLTGYVDIENGNDMHIDDIRTLSPLEFIRRTLSEQTCLEGVHLQIPVPSFMPPLKLMPLLTKRYLVVWYRCAEAVARARRILILGHSLRTGGDFFADMLRSNKEAAITVVDTDMDTISRTVCDIFGLAVRRYTAIKVQDFPARIYDNRITVIGADLKDVDIEGLL